MGDRLRKAYSESLLLPGLTILAGAYLLYANIFGNAWTFDDYPVIVNNPGIRSFWAFKNSFHFGHRTLRELSLLIDYRFFGLDPFGYHIQNIFWHGLNAALIFILVGRLGGSKLAAWTASVLFLAHPVQVEVVANISNRKDSLALAFSLLSFLAYTAAIQPTGKRFGWLAVSLSLAVLAFNAKQNALALSFALLGYEKVYLRPEERFLLRKLWPWALLLGAGVLFFGVWYFFFDGRESFLKITHVKLNRVNYFSDSTEFVYFSMVLKSWAWMALRLIFPANLAPEYIYPVPKTCFDPWTVSALAGLTLYGILLIFTLRRSPLAFWALVWLGAFWLPTSNLWPLSHFAADRYLYAPSVGFFILLGLSLQKLNSHPAVKVGLILIALISLSVLTWKQNAVWRSAHALWLHTVQISPQSSSALNNLGRAYSLDDQYDRAIELFLRAVDANPYNANPLFNLGRSYESIGEPQKAIEYYRRYIEMDLTANRFKVIALREYLKNRYGVVF